MVGDIFVGDQVVDVSVLYDEHGSEEDQSVATVIYEPE
jgi:hypothetical protein